MKSHADRVKQAPNPQAALIVIAEALDLLIAQDADDDWGEWNRPVEKDVTTPFDVEESEDNLVITYKKPSDHKWGTRWAFAKDVLELQGMLPNIDDVVAAYADGGPLWLYHGNRELVMSYPMSARQQMVADVLEDYPKEAHEMGRDILKFTGIEGPGTAVARGSE